jgi:hypothetical protein
MARPSSIFTSNPVEALYVQFFGRVKAWNKEGIDMIPLSPTKLSKNK